MDPKTGKFVCSVCEGTVKFGKSEMILGKYRTPGCPISKITERAVFYIALIDWSESTGKLPTAQTLFEESLFYFELRNFVLSESAIAENEMTPKEK
jgi:hypothetical protein